MRSDGKIEGRRCGVRCAVWIVRSLLMVSLVVDAGCTERGLEPCKHTCEDPGYPPGPFGSGMGQTLRDIGLRVWRDTNGDGVSDDAPMDGLLSDYHARSAAGGPRVLVVLGVGWWCGPCQVEQRDFNEVARANPSATFLTAILESARREVPGDEDVTSWARQFRVPHDVTRELAGKTLATELGMNLDAAPNHAVINLCDMKVLSSWDGYDRERLLRDVAAAVALTR